MLEGDSRGEAWLPPELPDSAAAVQAPAFAWSRLARPGRIWFCRRGGAGHCIDRGAKVPSLTPRRVRVVGGVPLTRGTDTPSQALRKRQYADSVDRNAVIPLVWKL
jgi:hypothetical protein